MVCKFILHVTGANLTLKIFIVVGFCGKLKYGYHNYFNFMQIKILTPKQALSKAYQKQKPFRHEIDNFKKQFLTLLKDLNPAESEEHNKNYVAAFLKDSFYSEHLVNTSGKIDLAVYSGKDSKSRVAVIGEVKSPSEKHDMPAKDNLNVKAMHQVMLYFLRERIDERNDEIKNIIITNGYEWFIFDARLFEKLFNKNTELVKNYKKWANDKKISSNTDHFYKEIAADFLNKLTAEIEFVHFDIRKFKKSAEAEGRSDEEKKVIPVFKIFSKPFLLSETFSNDSNTLDKSFYNELLHIIGLEEVKEGSKKLIRRKDDKGREPGSILENTIEKLKSKETLTYFEDAEKYGEDDEERLFNISLQLNITWINRILFLKLLEAQLVNYHRGNADYKFLDPKVISEYDDLDELFHEVLARKLKDRTKTVNEKFQKIPYLNSSLFERSELERNTLSISELKDRFELGLHPQTVLKDDKEKRLKGKSSTLKYLLKFLDAYDFATESTGDEIQEEGKSIINASVLGLIFEKINGYKEGSFFTPGFITMYMSRETIRRAVVQKFNDTLKTGYKDFEELKNEIDRNKEGRKKANEIINSLKVCDPAVGSGHFLVSVLNEIIAVKSELGILCYRDESRVQNYSVEIENDELIITDLDTEDIFKYHLNEKGNIIPGLQKLQETIFHEKQTIIENCLFGVDINPNSVNICRLRLWIELLKHSYYTEESKYKELETLPNIDINIKQGNSLISRFDLGDQVFTKGDKTLVELYKMNVKLYKNATDRNERKKLKDSIDKIREKVKGIYVDPLSGDRKQLRSLNGELNNLTNQVSGFEDVKLEEKKEKLQNKIDKLTEKIVKQEDENDLIFRDAFEWRFEFPEVLDEDGNFEGFDVVIGNPPYGIHFKSEHKNFLKDYYKKVHVRTLESFNYFVLRFSNISSNSGFCCFIIPSSFLNQIEFSKARKNILEEYYPYLILNLGDGVFDDVTTSTCIIGFSKFDNFEVTQYSDIRNIDRKLLPNSLIELKSTVDYKKLLSNQSYSFIYSPHQSIITKCYRDAPPFKKIVEDIATGISSGLDKAYVYTDDEIDKKKFESSLLKKLITGTEIQRYMLKSSLNKKVIYITSDESIKNYPAIEKELLLYKSQLGKRREAAKGLISWYSLNWPRRQKLFEKNKILIRQTASEIIAAYDDDRWYCLKSGLIVQLPDNSPISYYYLLGLLNSSLINFLYKDLVYEENRIFPEVKPVQLFKLPIKIFAKSEAKKIEKLVGKIIKLKKENPKADTSALEKEIDQLVYKLYNLTEEEIKIVEKSAG